MIPTAASRLTLSQTTSRAAQNAFAGHMRPAGRVFETPVLEISCCLVLLFLLLYFGAQSEAE